jgi:integrase
MAYAEKRAGKLTGRWVGRVRVKEKEFQATFDRKKDAEGYETYCRLMGEQPPTMASNSGRTFADVAAECRSAGGRRGRWKAGRDVSVAQRLDHVVQVLGHLDIEHVDRAALERLVRDLEKRPGYQGRKALSGATINRYLHAASSVLSYAEGKGYITRKPELPRQIDARKREEVVSPAQEAALLACLEADGERAVALVVRVLIESGLRVGELYKLRADQIENGWIGLRGDQTKNDLPRRVYIGEDLGRDLRALLASEGLPNISPLRRKVRAANKKCGHPAELVLHSFRHTRATRIIKATGNMRVAQVLLGHRSIVTTQRYAHVLEEDQLEAAKKVSERFGQSPENGTVVPFAPVKKTA